MFRYEAPAPYQKKSFFSFSNPSSISSCASIGKLVLPAQWLEPVNINDMTLNQFKQNFKLTIQGGYVGTHDDAVLDTIELTPQAEFKEDLKDQHFIIKCNGNCMLYEKSLRDYAIEANKLGVTIIGFNYRGVGNSKKEPETFQDLVTDGIAQVQRLLDKGVDSKKITIDGLSLGGGVATMVASHFHKIGKPIYLWNDRSFATISKAAAGTVAPEARNLFLSIVETSLQATSWSIMQPAGWDENIAKAYKTIPAEYKAYMYVAKESERSHGDGVISHSASLHTGVKKDEQKNHNKTGHKVYALFDKGHNLPRSKLVSSEDANLSGQDQYEQFIKKHMKC